MAPGAARAPGGAAIVEPDRSEADQDDDNLELVGDVDWFMAQRSRPRGADTDDVFPWISDDEVSWESED